MHISFGKSRVLIASYAGGVELFYFSTNQVLSIAGGYRGFCNVV